MKIITVNTNGIRAAQRKGFYDWLEQEKADVRPCLPATSRNKPCLVLAGMNLIAKAAGWKWNWKS